MDSIVEAKEIQVKVDTRMEIHSEVIQSRLVKENSEEGNSNK